jgi:hypothetical protein
MRRSLTLCACAPPTLSFTLPHHQLTLTSLSSPLVSVSPTVSLSLPTFPQHFSAGSPVGRLYALSLSLSLCGLPPWPHPRQAPLGSSAIHLQLSVTIWARLRQQKPAL